ncbi:MAG: type II toxin-antitoxin system VapB family antitoxin [Alphaproteobacteria bacterium]|nr:type II toxin-antitoxin system VapB family antitoxin [Alphaproteobacteria bacterium]MDE2631322.1 type II toxin-antitoxin system VapB family antitoxin [Alphaproteobacteria bacterium]
MALHISNQKANRLARKLARQTGETLTDAVIRALEERLAKNDLRGRENREARKAAILEVARAFGALSVLDNRPADEILGYDENGLPS